MVAVGPTIGREEDDVLDLDLDDVEVPFEPVDVLGTEHEDDTLTVYTVTGGGASLVLSVEEPSRTRSTPVADTDLTAPLRTGLSYLFRDGIRTVRVRIPPESATDALSSLGTASSYRYDELSFTASVEN
ncbi:hypothetical protein [Haladaptatus paucihalophilus]|uniref:Uncharacterized protein n=1 Tax=Haladaptatus paucihalophilus DX253 TaxID=797209 RepID=A0A1M7B5D5_HALPU|nr:hypothetical protein [Haladaptatus paucihalophilus]SHL50200.1 hypothetical protein SAMN05444342_3982 [Haladaptatus paucihalophilus DX253]